MHQLAQSWLIYDLTGSPFLVGLSGVFLSVPFVLMSLYAGALVDRADRRKLLIAVEAANISIALLITVLVATSWIQVWHLYAGNVLSALVGAFENPARSSLLPYLVPRRDLMTAISLNSMLRRGSQIIGPALGGISIGLIGVPGTYLAYSLASLGLLGSVVLIRTTNPAAERSSARASEAIMAGLRYVRGHALISTLLFMEAATNLFGAHNAMMVVFAREVFAVGPQGLGLLQSASGAGTVAGSVALAWAGDVRRKGRLVLGGGLVYACGVAAFAFCPWFLLAIPVLAVAGAAEILMAATRTTMIQLLAQGPMLGRVMSLHAISTRGIGPFGGAQAGALTELVGVRWAVGIGALICAAITLAVGLRVPAVRDFAEAGEPAEAQPARARSAAQP